MPKKKKGRSFLRTRIITRLKVGESATFTADLELGNLAAASELSRTIGAYASRRCPGSTFTYETFTTLTSQQRPIVGIVLTRLSGEPSDIDAPVRINRCKICQATGHYAKTCPEKPPAS